jgi:hypothetical protein
VDIKLLLILAGGGGLAYYLYLENEKKKKLEKQTNPQGLTLCDKLHPGQMDANIKSYWERIAGVSMPSSARRNSMAATRQKPFPYPCGVRSSFSMRPGHMSSIVVGLTDAKIAPIIRQLVAEGKLPDPWEIRQERNLAAAEEKRQAEEVKLAQMTPEEREAYEVEKKSSYLTNIFSLIPSY